MSSEHDDAQLWPTDVQRIMLDNSRHFIGLLEPDGVVIAVNQSVVEIHSDYEPVIGRPLWESPVWLSRDHIPLQQAVLEAARGEPVQLEVEVISSDGRHMTVDFSVRPIRNDENEIVLLMSEGHDSTERKQSAAVLEQQRLFLQAVLDNIADGIVACDAEGVLTVFNPASRLFHNLREAPIHAADWAAHYDLYQADGLTPLPTEEIPLYRALRGEIVHDVEMVIAPKGGQQRRLLANGRSLACPTGTLLGAVVAMHDITEVRAAESALRESEARYRAVVNVLSEGIVQQDQTGRVVLANPAAERILGLTQAQLLEQDGLNLRWYMVYEDGTPLEDGSNPAMMALRTGEPQEGAIIGVHKPNGVLTWVLVNCQPLWRLGEAEAYAVVSSFTDITALKQTEAQLRFAAQHDALTGLPTASLFMTRLEQAVAYAVRDPDYRFAVLYIDLDGFKAVNDTLGHNIGDNLLVTVARQLERCVRGSDTVARLGGDEFAVLFEHLLHLRDATQLAERVLHDLAISLNVAGREVSVSASVGVVLSDAPRPARELLEAADAAMYQAKAAGKAQYRVVDKNR